MLKKGDSIIFVGQGHDKYSNKEALQIGTVYIFERYNSRPVSYKKSQVIRLRSEEGSEFGADWGFEEDDFILAENYLNPVGEELLKKASIDG